MLDWMLMPYKRYADFSGRSRRKEYWMFYLLFMIVYVVCAMLMATGVPSVDPVTGEVSGGGGILSTLGMAAISLFGLGSIIPSLAVSIRRMHDQDRSGWWILCPILNFVFLFIEGTRGDNRFGPDPKAGEA